MYLRRFNSWCFYDFFYPTNADLARNAKVKKRKKVHLLCAITITQIIRWAWSRLIKWKPWTRLISATRCETAKQSKKKKKSKNSSRIKRKARFRKNHERVSRVRETEGKNDDRWIYKCLILVSLLNEHKFLLFLFFSLFILHLHPKESTRHWLIRV